ncbi:MAG TPA: phosphopentomutase [Firmicutes bacterium]|nr:phosphopentomutase [Bacillota bacterium]
MEMKRVFIVVLDGAGVGSLPDARTYGDEGSNTLGHIASLYKNWCLPNLLSLGLGKIVDIPVTVTRLRGAFGKMTARSPGKDTTSGHWELAGLVLDKPFPVYPSGFPLELIAAFAKAIGRGVLGNVSASGTEIIGRLGEAHLRSGFPIVYTSADSVFQIAAHEEVVSRELLYRWCSIAREEILTGEHAVGRVIARPFIGKPGNFQRTGGRKDFSLVPPGKTILERLQEKGFQVWAVGKVKDVFAARGITHHLEAAGNREIMARLRFALSAKFRGILWATLVDFDMLYGHRNDVNGFARAMEEFDIFLGGMIENLSEGDFLFISADHGCDPTFPGTDHTREYVPILAYTPGINIKDLGIRDTFADMAATIAELFHCKELTAGQSFALELFGRSEHPA